MKTKTRAFDPAKEMIDEETRLKRHSQKTEVPLDIKRSILRKLQVRIAILQRAGDSTT
jgi:hypothetical protein